MSVIESVRAGGIAPPLSGLRRPKFARPNVRRAGIGFGAGILTALVFAGGLALAQEAEQVLDLIQAVDTIWFVIAGILVFFMQAGFGLLEAGFVRVKNTANILMKNVLDASIGGVVWWICGFGFAFGSSTGSFIGGDQFFLGLGGLTAVDGVPTAAVFFFQWAFAATAATIVSGALAERTKFSAYLFYTVFITGIIYPIVIHWGWGGGWLGENGFMDYAGSTLVHSVGAWAGLMGAILVGPRIGKYAADGSVNAIPGHNMTLGTLGMFILWFGWYGFNPGSTLGLTDGLAAEAAWIAINTTLAAGAGAVIAMAVAKFRYGKADLGLTLNGALAGLVSITAGCGFVEPWAAVLIGAIGGALVVFSVAFFDKIRVDDPVGAISVHGACGVWGTLATGLFATAAAAEAWGAKSHGLFMGGGFTGLLWQIIGVLAVFGFVAAAAGVLFFVIKNTTGLRVDESEELAGLDVQEHGIGAYPEFPTVAPGTAVEVSAGEEAPAPGPAPAAGG